MRDRRSTTRAAVSANLTLLLVSLGVTLGVCELLARVFLPAPLPWLFPQVSYRPDPTLVFTLAPEQRAYSADKQVGINARGMRGALVPYARTPDTARLLFIGDSIAFGYGVTDEQVVTARVASLLAAHGRPTEVVNGSVPAYNTEQEVAFLEREGVRYRPDWVVVAVCWNDLSDKSGDRVSPEGWLVRAGTDDASRLASFGETGTGYLLRNAVKRSRLVYAVTQGGRVLAGRLHPDDATLFRAEILEGRATSRTEDGWRRVEAAIHHLKELSARFGFRPLLVTFPLPLALEGSFPHSAYPAGFRTIAEREGLPFLDLEPSFRAAYHGHESLFIPYDADHPNAQGHDLAAHEIVRFLEASRGT